MLQQAMNKILNALAIYAASEEEDFFQAIQDELNELCELTAQEINADSAAVFFETEDNPPGMLPFMVMRGAYGQLVNTFSQSNRAWRNWRKSAEVKWEARPATKGFAYVSQITKDYLELGDQVRRQFARRWSTTNQIWHLAQGRLANSNRAMDELHGGDNRAGQGDNYAYMGTTLGSTFRTMIGVPIFAQGKIYDHDKTTAKVQTQTAPTRSNPYPSSASSNAEFHAQYRVIGILKVENKRPLYDIVPDLEFVKKRLDNRLKHEKIDLNASQRAELESWLTGICKDPAITELAFTDESCEFPGFIDAQTTNSREQALRLRKVIADVMSECYQAQFTRQDMELLVLLAMQLGRLMTHRIIKYAADNDITISENEIGLLNMQWSDIDQLVALHRAAEVMAKKVKHHLHALQVEMDLKQRQSVYGAQVSELLDTRGPIHDVSARTKEYMSLIRKLVRKQRAFENSPYNHQIVFTDLSFPLENYSHRSGYNVSVTGRAQFALYNLTIGKGNAELKMRLGMQDATHINVNETDLLVAVDREPRRSSYAAEFPFAIRPLVYRILSPDIYGVDDLAGVRVITDYNSGVDEILTELRAHVGEWGIEIRKVDDLREGKEGGYRAVHITLSVNASPLLKAEDQRILREALQLKPDQPLKIPVEIQLRTAYQHSWSMKIHTLLYKREEQIAQGLLDEQEILSNVLAEADWLSDIVRSDIETMLLPSDYGERRLLAHLQRRIHPDDLSIIRFGIDCAKEVLKDKLRYNGQLEISFAMEVCECLVYRFSVTDSTLLLSALLYNIWRTRNGDTDWAVQTRDRQHREQDADMVSLFCEKLEQTCYTVLDHHCHRLPIDPQTLESSDWLKLWMERLPDWFWVIQRSFCDFFLAPREELRDLRKTRLQDIYHGLKNRHSEGTGRAERESFDEWLERAFMLEAAILLADLTDLPDEPGKARRKRLYNDYLFLFHEIRRYFPNSPTKLSIIEELDRAFREMETLMDLSREPDWWGE